ncbi:phosphotransferase [Lysobacter sp. H21R4]|uniref:aminoglycoside phosphotransferase family protein n=1 Tax=Lysobacter sp. H21R4 TaxID=2781021 RepID=UPI0018870C54|nr:phosphotransferase [Lysobacter sp. H21R4]QOY63463.1 phosphotransferase [Lysobacter sp. H21R4]
MNQVVAESRERADARLDWARRASGHPALTLQRASMDAGFRSYWRSAGHDGTPWIVMDSPPDKEDVAPWLRVRDLLERHDVRVPRVLAQDERTGFVLMEDLGGPTYLQVITADNADALFDAAIGELLKLQALPCAADLPAYDDALLTRELALFPDWFLDRHLGIELSAAEQVTLAEVNRFLVDAALAQPQVFVHRDFMPRNLMPVDAGPAVLDFQDAVRGPIAYDPISLFKDAFLSWPEAKVEEWLGRYHARAVAAGLPVPALDRFRRDADLIGVQRHLKILGIFARLWHRDGKPRYLADAPRFIGYLDAVLPRYPQLAGLAGIIDRHVKPAMAARPFQPPA